MARRATLIALVIVGLAATALPAGASRAVKAARATHSHRESCTGHRQRHRAPGCHRHRRHRRSLTTGAGSTPAASFAPPAAPPSSPPPDTTPPKFAGLRSAFACTPGPQTPGETTPYNLSWEAASDDLTPPQLIVYDVYLATVPGGEDFSQPTWTTAPGVSSFETPGLPSHGTFYFVVRARDQAGNEDRNTVELQGVDPCV